MASTLRALCPIYARNNRPSRWTIERLVKKFESTGTAQNVSMPVGQRSARSVENIGCRWGFSWRKPKCVSQTLDISVTSLWRILRNDLDLHSYKIKLTQELKPLDHQNRRMFQNRAEKQLENGLWAVDVIGPYLFRDEQNFHFTVNRHRYRSMITEYFWPQLDDMDIQFQQYGTASHSANVTINLLYTKFWTTCYITKWSSRVIWR